MRVLVVMLLMTCLGHAPVHGATRNVPDEYATIQAAVDASVGGDRILVDGGEYDEDVLVLAKSVDIVSQHGAAETTVSSVSFTAGQWEACEGSVKGFKITGSLSAGSVDQFVLRDCEVLGPVNIWSTEPVWADVDVDFCTLRSGLGIDNGGDTDVSDCEATHIGVGWGHYVSVARCDVKGGGICLYGFVCWLYDCVLENGSSLVSADCEGHVGNSIATSGNLEVYGRFGDDYGMIEVWGNTIADGGIAVHADPGVDVYVEGNTVYGCGTDGMGIDVQSAGIIDVSKNIVASCNRGIVWASPPDSADLLCNDVWQNPGGDWIGIPNPTGSGGNMCLDPMFCDPPAGDLTLASDSPCLSGNPGNGDCGQIGALGLGCEYPSVVPESAGPTMLFLARPAPNPFSGETVLSYGIPAANPLTRVRLDIVDPSGRVVRGLVDGVAGPGTYRVRWNGSDDRGAALPSGIYWSRLRVGDREMSERIVRVR
jgi:hypothetical protein